MKAKLIKDSDGYWLDISDDGITKRPLTDFGQLSIKNCESIANGYDLDELAREACNITDPLRLDSQKYKQDPYFKIGFNKGFNVAVELLGDKKFSEDDMLSFESFVSKWYDKAKDIEEFTALPSELLVKWKSLQQTEWDVEIEMTEDWYDGFKSKPKLDADDCLILRRI